MISELGKSCTVYTTDKQVGIRIHKAIAMQQTFSNKQNPPSVGRKYRRGKILVRVCYNTGFNTFFIINFPNFRLTGSIGTNTQESLFAGTGQGFIPEE